MQEETKVGFFITDNKGFHITFENGWTVSVQFGRGSYSDNYDYRSPDAPGMFDSFSGPVPKSGTAEVAAWPSKGDMIPLDEGTTVGNRYTPDQVLALMIRIAAMPA